MRLRDAAVALVGAVALSLPAGPGAAQHSGPGGLSASQVSALRRLPFQAVVPDRLPRGFTLKTFDVHSNSYRLVYQRADGATLFFGGSTGGKQPAPAEKKPRGFFQKIAASVSHAGSSSKSSNDDSTSGEYERHQTSVVKADNPYAGTATFVAAGSCRQGSGDTSNAQITNATFSAGGCGLGNRLEYLTTSYRSLRPV